MTTRWKITSDRVGKAIEFFAWGIILIAGLHVAEFIIASFITIWSLFLIHHPEHADRIYILFLWQGLWISILVGGLLLSRLRKKKERSINIKLGEK